MSVLQQLSIVFSIILGLGCCLGIYKLVESINYPSNSVERLKRSIAVGFLGGVGAAWVAIMIGIFDKTYHWSLGGVGAIFFCFALPAQIIITAGTYIQLGYKFMFQRQLEKLKVPQKEKSNNDSRDENDG